MVDGDVFRMSEAADTAESAAVRFARKQTNIGRAAERACQELCYAKAAQQDAADATAAEQEARRRLACYVAQVLFLVSSKLRLFSNLVVLGNSCFSLNLVTVRYQITCRSSIPKSGYWWEK